MVQRVGASYVGKKLYNYIMTTPEPPDDAAPDASEPVHDYVEAAHDDLHGEIFLDENDEPLGTAHRLAEVAVYVVTDGIGSPASAFAASLDDAETRLYWRTVDGRISALIYVPDPSKFANRPAAMRADEV